MLEKTGRLARLLSSAEALRQETLAPQAAAVDRDGQVPVETLGKLWDQGFLSLLVPREYDGQGASLLEAALCVEELARGCASTALLVVIQCLGALPILIGASSERKERWLKEIVHGRKILAFALSEPQDDEFPETRAEKDGNAYRLTGRKAFVTYAAEADMLAVFAATDPQAKLKNGLSCFIIERGISGLHLARTEPRLGLRGLPPADLVFDACAVAEDRLVGAAGEGFTLADISLQQAGVLLASLAVGVMQAAVDALKQDPGLAWLAAGDPKSHPAEYLLADISMALESCRALTYRAAGAWETGAGEFKWLSHHAKCLAADSAVRALQTALELGGQRALLGDQPLGRLLRDAQCLPVLLRPNPSVRKAVARALFKAETG